MSWTIEKMENYFGIMVHRMKKPQDYLRIWNEIIRDRFIVLENGAVGIADDAYVRAVLEGSKVMGKQFFSYKSNVPIDKASNLVGKRSKRKEYYLLKLVHDDIWRDREWIEKEIGHYNRLAGEREWGLEYYWTMIGKWYKVDLGGKIYVEDKMWERIEKSRAFGLSGRDFLNMRVVNKRGYSVRLEKISKMLLGKGKNN